MEEKQFRFRWWHGLAFFAGVQVAQLGARIAVRRLTQSRNDATGEQDQEIYREMRLPVFAPPGWAFPVAWSINSFCLVAGGLHVLNLPGETPGRAKFLRCQAAAWGVFSLFDTAYFGLRSPINAAALTLVYSGLTVASMAISLRKLQDRAAMFSLATTLAWLALANPVAVAQATWNRDPFWKVGPFLEPPKGWEKKQRQS